MEIDIDVYFWMVDRGLFDDDQRNKVDMDRNKVKLHREHQQKFENAYYIGKIMLLLKKSIMKISKKPFTLDPGVSNLKDNITSSSKQMNWNVIAKELKKFGIKVDQDKKAKIIEGRWQSINEILGKLFDVDNGGIQSGRFQDGNMSEIFNLNDRDHSVNGALNANNNNNDSTNVSIDGNTSIILSNPKKGNSGQLDPIQNAQKKISTAQQSQQDSTSLNASPSKIQLSSVQNSANRKMMAISNSVTSLNDINEAKDIAFSETTLEFILLSLSRSLQIKPKQAAGLLSNNHKFLVHITVKGMKGNDYSKIQQWYLDIYQNTQLLIQLIDNEKDQNAMKLTLNILKCGLFSLNMDLAANCSRLLSKIGQEINQIGGQLQGLAWDWLINQTMGLGGNLNLPNDLSNVQVPDFTQTLDANNQIRASDQPLNESGLSSLIFTFKRFALEGGLIEHITPVLIHFGKNNHMELFSFHLKNQFQNERGQYLAFIHDLMISHSKTSLFRDAIMNSGVFDEWLNTTLRMADFDGVNTVNDRIAAATFLADVWELKSDQFEEGLNGGSDTAQAILSVLKKGCRDRSKMLRVVCFELMFNLLHVFASGRNQFAPIIYKSLTFLLIEFHQDNETREQLMRHFVALFQQIQTIPVAIISEPLIKQIEISQNGVNTLQIALTQNPNPSYVFNVFDFEFFNVVVHHKRVNLATSLQVVDLLVNIATSNIFFANTSISIILEVIHKFSRDPTMHSQFSMITKTQIQMLEESEKLKQKLEQQKKKSKEAREKQLQDTINKNKTNKYVVKKIQEEGSKQSLDQDQELEAASLARQTKEKLVVNLLKQILMFGNDLIKQNMRNQLLSSYSRVEKQIKVKSKSIKYLLDLYGEDIPKMLQYFIENEQESSTNTEKIDQQIEIASVGLIPTLQNQLIIATDNGSTSSPPKRLNQKSAQHLEKVLKDIEKIKNNVTLKKDQKNLEEELKKARDEKVKTIAKKQVDQRKLYEHGVVPKNIRNFSLDPTKEANNSMDNQLQIKIIKAKDLDVSEIALEDEQRLIVPPSNPEKKKNPILKQLKTFQLYDLRMEEQKDQDAVRFFVKKNLKIFRNLFNRYANTTGPMTQVKETFDQLSQKNSLITVAELLKMLKEFSINNLQVSKDDVINMVRLINMEILKKKDKGQASLSVLEFEGFVEFLLQLAVHLYSFNAEMSPSQYLQLLFDHFKEIANKKGSNNAKLFDDPNQIQIGDSKLIQELNRRLTKDPSYQLPDGFSKVIEKEVVNQYIIPEFLPIEEPQRVVIEFLDGFLNDIFGFHFLEPMSEVKEVARAKPNLRMQAKDKIIHELNQQSNPKTYSGATPIIPSKRSRQNIRVSNSIDVNLIRQNKQQGKYPLDKLNVNNSINSSLFKSPRISIPSIQKPQLGIDLKLEVAKAPAQNRQLVLEAAYVMEEMLYSVENGLDKLPPPGFQQQTKKQIMNRVIEEKIKKQDNEDKQKQLDKQKLELRKQMLKDQLDKMRVEKDIKTKEDNDKKKQQEEKEKQKALRKQLKQREDIQNMMKDLQVKKEEKMKKEEEDKKKEEEKKVKKSDRVKSSVKHNLKERQKKIEEEFKKIAQDRKASIQREEDEKKQKKEHDKVNNNKIKQLYAETKNKAKELKEKYRQEFDTFCNQQDVREVFQAYDKQLQALFEQQCKMDSLDITKLSYNSYLKLGNKLSITPTIITSQDYIYVYKTIMRSKKDTSLLQQNDTITDAEGTKLNFNDFKEALVKIASLGKYKLGGLTGDEQEIKEREERLKDKVKLAVSSAKIAKQVNKSKLDQSLNVSVTSDKNDKDKLTNAVVRASETIFEKAFDVSGMTAITIENLFKHIGVKADAGLSKMNTMIRQSTVRQSIPQNNLQSQIYDSLNEREQINDSQLEEEVNQ